MEIAEHKQPASNAEVKRLHRGGSTHWRRIEKVFNEIERQNQLILTAAGEGIYGVDAEGKTTFLNPAAERMLGWSYDDIVGEKMHPMIHHSHERGETYPDKECPIYAAFRDGEIHTVVDEVFWRRDGTCFPVEYTSTPIMDNGQLVGAVIVFRDVSERKQAEASLRKALAEVEALKQKLELENAYLQEELKAEYNRYEIVGKSAALREVIRKIELVAPTDANVLISGETGTGKELIARGIHLASKRKNRPLIRVNCAAIPRELFESEFFGHVKGAFTGAVVDRAGRFELADGGTLFLDEVGEIPLELQGKLLRVLQDQQFERVGSDKTRCVDVRVIAATNRHLEQEVQRKLFREDLYFRLNVFPIESVPLRARSEDIPMLASHFLEEVCRTLNKPLLQLSNGEIEKLQAYSWPGNVRELENVIERQVIVARGGRLQFDLPASNPVGNRAGNGEGVRGKPSGAVFTDEQRRQRDRENIIVALRQSNGRVFGAGGAAQILGVKATTLASRLKKMKINPVAFKTTGA